MKPRTLLALPLAAAALAVAAPAQERHDGRAIAAAVAFGVSEPGTGVGWGRAVARIEEAAELGARYVVLPERALADPPGDRASSPTAPQAAPEEVPGPTTRFFGRIAMAHGIWLALSVAERSEDAAGYYVTTVLLDEHGDVRARRRKVAAGPDAPDGELRGDPMAVLEPVADGGRRIGVLAGDDLRAGVPRLAARGVDTVLVSSADPVGGATARLAAELSRRHGVHLVVAGWGGGGTAPGTAAWMGEGSSVRAARASAKRGGDDVLTVELPAVRSDLAPAPPLGLPAVPVPAGQVLEPDLVELGRELFFDPGLSRTGEVSCASCHRPDLAFTNGETRGRGVYGRATRRNVPSLLNVAYRGALFWDGRASTLESQAKYPISDAAEMDFHYLDEAVAYVRAHPRHAKAYAAAFGGEPVRFERVAEALAAYQRTLLSGGSAFDHAFYGGEPDALSPAARRGFELFVGRAGCVECHRIERDHALFLDHRFHNTGVGYDRETGAYRDPGLGLVSSRNGLFLTPSLRDVEHTAPYMHDGSLARLEDVVRFYAGGGVPNPNLDPRLRPLDLDGREVADLVAFLRSLTGGDGEPRGAERPLVAAIDAGPRPERPLIALLAEAASAGARAAVLPDGAETLWPAELGGGAAAGSDVTSERLAALAAAHRLWIAAPAGDRLVLVDDAGRQIAEAARLESQRLGLEAALAGRAFRDLRAVATPFGRVGLLAGDDVIAGIPRLAELGADLVLVASRWDGNDPARPAERGAALARRHGVRLVAAGGLAAAPGVALASGPAGAGAGSGGDGRAAVRLLEMPAPARPAAPGAPLGLPEPPLPARAASGPEWVELGRSLFFDPRLSRSGEVSCATCHDPAKAFADGRRTPRGVEGRAGHRNTPSLLNVGYRPFLFWDGTVRTLERQMAHALEGWSEMDSRAAEAVAAVADDPGYRRQVRRLTGRDEIELGDLARAIAAFERTLVSGASPFDRYRYAGQDDAIGPAAKRGLALFVGKARCAECHTVGESSALFSDDRFHNTGVGYHPRFDYLGYGGDGLESNVATGNDFRGEYLTPILRGIAETAPYMHDGSLSTLAEVVDFYDRGGVPNPFLDPAMRPLGLSDEERADLVAFLETLSGAPPETIADAAARPAGGEV